MPWCFSLCPLFTGYEEKESKQDILFYQPLWWYVNNSGVPTLWDRDTAQQAFPLQFSRLAGRQAAILSKPHVVIFYERGFRGSVFTVSLLVYPFYYFSILMQGKIVPKRHFSLPGNFYKKEIGYYIIPNGKVFHIYQPIMLWLIDLKLEEYHIHQMSGLCIKGIDLNAICHSGIVDRKSVFTFISS